MFAAIGNRFANKLQTLGDTYKPKKYYLTGKRMEIGDLKGFADVSPSASTSSSDFDSSAIRLC